MFSKITSNIKVTVYPDYDARNSFPSENRFVFKYHISIENLSGDAIQILKRKWLIYDVGFGSTEVIGDGVIGLTPEIYPGEKFTYFSNVMLRSGVGNMRGKYRIKNLRSEEQFEIDIPKFLLHSHILRN